MTLITFEKKINKYLKISALVIVLAVLIYNALKLTFYYFDEKRINIKQNDINLIETLKKENILLHKRIEGNKHIDKLNADMRELNAKCAIKKEVVMQDMGEIFTKLSDKYNQFDITSIETKDDLKFSNLLEVSIVVSPRNNNISKIELFNDYQRASRDLVYLFLLAFKDEFSIYQGKIVPSDLNKITFTLINKCDELLNNQEDAK
jgi:hypothetical protein